MYRKTGNWQLFDKIINNTQHLLYCLLPPQREQLYELRQRDSAPTVLPSTPTTGAALWTKTASI